MPAARCGSWRASTVLRPRIGTMNHAESPSPALRAPSPPVGERDGVRGFGSWKSPSISRLRVGTMSRLSAAVAGSIARLFQRRKVFDQIDQVLSGHRLLETRGHDRKFLLILSGNVTLLVSRDDARLGFHGDLVGCIADD